MNSDFELTKKNVNEYEVNRYREYKYYLEENHIVGWYIFKNVLFFPKKYPLSVLLSKQTSSKLMK